MTGRELALVVAAAGATGLLGGFVGVAAGGSGMLGPRPAPRAPDGQAEALARLERAVERAADESKAAGRKLDHLTERLTALELGAARGADEPSPSDPAGRPRAARPQRSVPELGGVVAATELSKLPYALGHIEGARLDLGSVAESLKLLQLPEAERWEMARKDLQLSEGQVEELRRAMEERREAMKAAARSHGFDDQAAPVLGRTEGGGRITITTYDQAAAREANDAYRRRVDSLLNTEQRRLWDEKGYDRAFGVHSAPTLVFRSTGSSISISHRDDAKEPK